MTDVFDDLKEELFNWYKEEKKEEKNNEPEENPKIEIQNQPIIIEENNKPEKKE